jgi:hypothetical protein
VKDFIRPNITRLAVYPLNSSASVDGQSTYKTYEIQGWGEQHRVKDHAVIKATGEIAFGISTHDTHNDSPNRNGVYSIELLVDSVKVFGFIANRFSFDETRFINSYIDYAHFIRHRERLIRSEKDKMNRLSLYDGNYGKGTFTIHPGKTYRAEYIVTDYHGNVSRLPFTIQGVEPLPALRDSIPEGQKVIAGQALEIKTGNYHANFTANAFYRDFQLAHRIADAGNGQLSPVLSLGEATTPVHTFFDLGIKTNPGKIPHTKLLVAYLEEGKDPAAIGGKYENGFMVARVRALGNYVVMADTTKPTIRPLNFKNGSNVSSLKQLRVEIEDDFSGIDTYRPSLNGNWILMEYDPKNKLLFYDIDERLRKGNNNFELTVRDKCGNTTIYRAEVSR